MRKTLTTIVIVAVLLIFTSSYNAYDVDVKVNAFAPNFSVSDNGRAATLGNLRGQFVLVNFWSSQDAGSRIRNAVYDKFAANNASVNLISVNFDSKEALYKEVLRRDRLNGDSQFYDKDGQESEVYKQYHLESGFSSYLINREGKIVAVNPTKQQLTDLTCQ